MLIVSDSSPLIALESIGSFDLLKALFDKVFLPPAVFQEITKGGKPGADTFISVEWLSVKEPKDTVLIERLNKENPALHMGEIEAVALAYEMKADFLAIDEKLGRRVAKEMHLVVIGVLGILALARQQGHLDSIVPSVELLKANGFRVSEAHIKLALRQAGEL